jgi:zinc transport system substrate-binding protein
MQARSFIFGFLTMIVIWCGGPVSAAGELPVIVSIVPQKYFVQQIGKGLVDIHVMVMPGASPHTYEPKPQQMAAVAKGSIYFSIGVPFEKVWLPKIVATNPSLKVVPTDVGIKKLPMHAHRHPAEEEHPEKTPHEKAAAHGEDEDHSENGILDPHIWTSPPLVAIQAQSILTALQEVDPAHRAEYEANYNTFLADITALDADLRATFAGKQGLQFMVFHPAWGYFAHTYGLEQVPVEIEGKAPKPAQLQELIEHARERGIKVVFVQPQFSTKSAALIAAEIGGEVIFADPLSDDWAGNMRAVAQQFKAALR